MSIWSYKFDSRYLKHESYWQEFKLMSWEERLCLVLEGALAAEIAMLALLTACLFLCGI